MKRTFIILITLLQTSLFAQDYTENTIQVFVGAPTNIGLNLSEKYEGSGQRNVAFGFGWRSRISETLEIDLTGGYERGITGYRTEKFKLSNGINTAEYRFREHFYVLTFLVGIHNNWYEDENQAIYSSINGGIAHVRTFADQSLPVNIKDVSDIDGIKFSYHLTALGYQLKFSQNIGIFGEVGYGSLGILKGGLAISF